MSRGRAVIKATKEEFTEFVTNLANRNKYVDNYKDGSVIEKINDNLFVCWVKYKTYFPMDDRDIVYVVGIFREENRTIIAQQSIAEGHPKAPAEKGVVRGEMRIGGWIVTQINDKEVEVIQILSTDPKGNVP
jgi:hypothetical protein